MKFPRKLREELSINITPLIDVVFLLLIFFMVTTTFTRDTRLVVNLPEADAEEVMTNPQQIEIVVSSNGSFSINGRRLISNELSSLMQGLQQVSQGDTSLPVLLIADAEATHQSVVTAMDGIGQSGFSRLSIATRRPTETTDNEIQQ